MMSRLALLALTAVGITACAGESTSPEVFEDPTLRWAALSKACPADAPAIPLSEELKASTPPRSSILTIDDQYADIARTIPGGWGGPAFSRNRIYYMFLVDPNQKDAAVTALTSRGIGASSETQVLKGRWDFAQLYDWYRYLGPNALRSVRWSSSDINEAENRIVYSVIDEGERVKLESLLSTLDVPCYLVAIRIMGYPTSL